MITRFVAVALIVFCFSCVNTPGPLGQEQSLATTNPAKAPPVGTFPAANEQIQTWIDNESESNIRAHAWSVWESVTSDSHQECQDSVNGTNCLPVFQTWYSGHEVFNIGCGVKSILRSSKSSTDLSLPMQKTTAAGHVSPGEALSLDEEGASFNRYSPALAELIWNRGYDLAATLDNINSSFEDSPLLPVEQRSLHMPNNAQAIIVKTVFQFIDKDSVPNFKYWTGVNNSTNPSLPDPTTWKAEVTLNPGINTPNPSCNNPVGLDAFYNVPLTQTDVDTFARYYDFSVKNGTHGADLDFLDQIKSKMKVGNIAVLVGAHVTTGEADNWTWQTFWWTCNSQDDDLKDRPSTLPAPWSNYAMTTGYYTVGKKSGKVLTGRFNPYIEAQSSGNWLSEEKWLGKNSNCISCHQVARWPFPADRQNRFQPYGSIFGADYPKGKSLLTSKEFQTIFGSQTRLGFLWSLSRACGETCLQNRHQIFLDAGVEEPTDCGVLTQAQMSVR